MSKSDDVDLLVRAFKIAWVDYYQSPGSRNAVSQELARPALSTFLVDKVREGMDDEAALAEAGREFLYSLEAPSAKPVATPGGRFSVDSCSWDMRLDNAGARFIPTLHVPSRTGRNERRPGPRN
jgi:hypothetical protein